MTSHVNRETVRTKLMRVLKRRKTAIGTLDLAAKAGVNYNSAKDELRRMRRMNLVRYTYNHPRAFWYVA